MDEPEYARDLNLRYEMEYLDCLAIKLLNGNINLGFKVVNFDQSISDKIEEHIGKMNLIDDKIHYVNSMIIIMLAKKYYNEDGTLKEKYK